MLTRLFIAFMRLMARWPLPCVRALGAGLGALLWCFAARRRHITLVNLRLCFAELDEAQRRRMARAHFRVFGQSVLDRAWLWHAPESVLRERLQWQGAVDELQAPGPLVLFAPHFVGLDAGGMAVSMRLSPAPVAFIFVAQSNPVIEDWVRGGRERMGNTRAHFRHQGMRAILSGLKQGQTLHLSPDMDFGPEESLFVPFMGVPAATLPSLSRLARVGRARVVPVVTRMTDTGYAIEAHPRLQDFPGEDLAADTARMNALLETLIRTMPEQYHWVHRRFKSRPEGQAGVY